jgi:hypothetical protein
MNMLIELIVGAVIFFAVVWLWNVLYDASSKGDK